MRELRIAVIGHVVLDSRPVRLPARREAARKLVSLHNYTRVVDDDGRLVDHLSVLGEDADRFHGERLSVWKIFLAAGLLLDARLRAEGHDARLFNVLDISEPEGFHALSKFAPDIVALGTTFVLTPQQFGQTARAVRAAAPGAFIVAGGQHVFNALLFLDAERRAAYLADCGLDALINDPQGEAALCALVRALAKGETLAHVTNLLWRGADGIVENARKREHNAISALLPDFKDVPPGAVVHVRTARSCSFNCAFCTYPSVAGELALMEVDTAMAVLRLCAERRVGAVVFTDDTFNVPPDRFEALLDAMIAEDLGLRWYSFLRCQYVTEAIVEKMRRSGCAGVFLGIESGSDRILKNMKKGAIIDFYRQGIRWLRERGIVTVGAFIFGFPGETTETVAETRAFIAESGLDFHFLQPFFYLHQAPIHGRAAEFGLTGGGLFWSHATMNWKGALDHLNRAFLEVDGPIHLNPDLNLWEYAYLAAQGVSDAEFRDYRRRINAMTAEQMRAFDLVEGGGGHRGVAGA